MSQGGSEDLLKQLRSHQEKYNEHVKLMVYVSNTILKIRLLEGQGRVTHRVRTTEEIRKMVQDLKKSTGTILEDIQTLEWINIKKQIEDNAHRIPLSGGWMDRKYDCPEPYNKPENKKQAKSFFGAAKSYLGFK